MTKSLGLIVLGLAFFAAPVGAADIEIYSGLATN